MEPSNYMILQLSHQDKVLFCIFNKKIPYILLRVAVVPLWIFTMVWEKKVENEFERILKSKGAESFPYVLTPGVT